MTSKSLSRSTGFVKKSIAPSRIVSTAVSIVPCPVSTITGSVGYELVILFISSSPDISGILKSVITRSMRLFLTRFHASFPFLAVRTW